MAKEKDPKPLYRYDPAKDRLNHLVHIEEKPKKPSVDALIEVLIFASEANERSGCAAWDLTSDLQQKIEKLVGPLQHSIM
jgi:hypothetical protein